MRAFLIASSIVGCILLAIFAYIGTGFWLSGRTHEFGSGDPRWWFLVRGTVVDALGLLEPAAATVRYTARAPDGNSPAQVIVSFRTAHAAERVLEAYAARCAQARLVARRRSDSALECDGAGSEIGVSALSAGGATEVTVGGWVR